MALIVADRVKETTNTTGTGTLSLAGAVAGFQSFVAGVGTTNTTYYAITDSATGDWEVGIGTVTSGTPDTLSRDTVLESSNSDNLVNFGAGQKIVICTQPAEKAVYLNASGNLDLAGDIDMGTNTITDTKVGQWDTAYGWGDHGAEGYLTGNQTITLSGDVSGSGTTSIIVTVADDSHNHVISNIDSLQTTLDSKLPLAGGTMTGFLTLNADPTSALHAATKEYVDTIASASLHYHDPVRVESPTALTVTYDNGTSGVGATLTNAGTQTALVIDGVTLALNDRVLIYTQTDATQNGVYYVSDVGSGSTNWVLTRTTDTDSYGASDPTALGTGDAFFVKEGNTGAGELYVMTTEGAITFGTTDIIFSQISSAAIYSAGTGLDLTGTVFSHADTSSQASVNNSNGTVIQDITLDTFGHITALGSADLDGRYYTETEVGNFFSGSTAITGYNKTNWDTAYGWGNHASAGYQAAATALTTSTTFGGDVSGTYNAIVVADDSHNHVISNVDGLQTALDAKQAAATALTTSTTFGGDVSGAYNAIVVANDSHTHDTRYYTETEIGSFFGGTTAITGYNKTNWDTAYGWGNHASAGYLTGNQTITLSGDVSGSGTTSIAVTITKDPVITLSGAVTGSATMTNLGNVTITTTATSDPTLTLTGDVTGSATFTNLGNATLTATVANDSHTHDTRYYTETESDNRYIIKGTGYEWTATGANALTFRSLDVMETSSGDQASLEVYQDTAGADAFMQFHVGGDFAAYFGLKGDINDFAVGGWSMGNNYYRVFHDNYHPNADTLTTARTITLSGAVTGSVSFNGGSNVTISTTATSDPTLTLTGDVTGSATFTNLGNATLTATVADNSHNHTNLDYVPERNRADWNDGTVIGDVIGQIAWKNYGNNHTIFDASASTSPDGTAVNNTNSQVAWAGTYPTLMGWNGANTYGVRVDSARLADSISGQANSATITASTAANANQIVLRDANGDDYRRYGFASYFNMSHAAATRSTDTVFYSSTDNYIRKNNSTGMRASLNVPTRTGGDASGTWGISITGNAATATASSGDFTVGSNLYVPNVIYHTGDTNTYMQFHADDQWRVVTGGAERLEINNSYALFSQNVVNSTHTATLSGSQTPNFSAYSNFVWTLSGNLTLANPTTEVAGMSGVFVFIHSGAARTVSLGTDYESVGGAGLTLSSTAGATDIVPYFVAASGRIILGTPQLAFS